MRKTILLLLLASQSFGQSRIDTALNVLQNNKSMVFKLTCFGTPSPRMIYSLNDSDGNYAGLTGFATLSPTDPRTPRQAATDTPKAVFTRNKLTLKK